MTSDARRMRAVVYAGAGGVEVISVRDVPLPEPGPGEICVRVRATALNRADILQRRGRYPAPSEWRSAIPGLEYAGEIEALGPGAARWRAGDRVMGLVGGGAHAEAVVVHEDEALPVPVSLDWESAAAVPEAFLTAFDALSTRARLKRGERVLVHAVGSGVGTAAVQLAHAHGATVLGTSRTPDKLERARSLGLDVPILTSAASFRELVGDPVDVVLDLLGGPAFNDNLAVLAPRGRLVLIGFLAGSRTDADLEPILRKRLEVIGTMMRGRGHEERAALAGAAERELLPLLERGTVRAVVDRVYAMERIADAHRAMEEGEAFGKIVLRW